MRNIRRVFIFCTVLLIVMNSSVSHAAISKPKNFRILYVSEEGKELESFEYSVYAVQQVFLDKLAARTYIDPKGYEYTVSGYRLKTWPGQNYTGTPSEDAAMGYNSILSALRAAYNTLDPPYSMQVSLVLHATGTRYAVTIPVHITWLNQDDEFVKETEDELGRDGTYTDVPPEGYEIISVKAYMTDIWKIGSEITVDPKSPTVKYNKFAEEYRIIYRLNLSPEEESEIMGLNTSSEEEPSETQEESGETPTNEETASGSASSEETSAETPVSTEAYSEPEDTETPALPTKTDESFSNGSKNITLILGLVIGIIVIYLIVISIGKSSSGKSKKKKMRL